MGKILLGALSAALVLTVAVGIALTPKYLEKQQKKTCHDLNQWSEYFQACIGAQGACVLTVPDLAQYDKGLEKYKAECLTEEQKYNLAHPKPPAEKIAVKPPVST